MAIAPLDDLIDGDKRLGLSPEGFPIIQNASGGSGAATPGDSFQQITNLKGRSTGDNSQFATPFDALKYNFTPTDPVVPGEIIHRDYFVPPANEINFVVNVPFRKLSVEDVLSDRPGYEPNYLSVRVQNTLGKGSIKVLSDKPRSGQTETVIVNQEFVTIEKDSKISIVRTDGKQYNIRSIKVLDENGVVVKETTSNIFDIPSVDREYTIVVDSYDVYTSDSLPNFTNQLKQAYAWNLELNNKFQLRLGVTNSTTYVRYYFPNQIGAENNGSKKIQVSNGEALIELNNPNAIGRYELIVFAGNDVVGDQAEIRTFIEVLQEKTYGEPDVTQIIYDRNIIEADLRPLDFKFDFTLQSVNAEGVNVYLGENLITNIPVQNNKTSVYYNAKELYELYKSYFNETPETYEITFTFQPYFNGIGGKIVGKKESVTVTVKRTKFLIPTNQALRDISGVFSQLFSGDDSKSLYEDEIKFEDDKHLYYQVRTSGDQSFVITNTGMDTLTFSVLNGKVVETQFEIDTQTGSTRKKRGYQNYGSLIVKLLEPLPAEIDLNTQVWISKQIIPTIVESIIITDEDDDKCLVLKPNFSTDVINETGLQFFDEIVSSGSLTSTDIVNRYISQSSFNLDNLNIEYTSGSNPYETYFVKFENFVNFGSAQTRLENFQYKIETIESWEDKINTTLYSASLLSTSSISLLTSASYNDKINAVKNGFDGFEKTMYDNFDITSSNHMFFVSQSSVTELYDVANKNYLVKHVPEFIKEDSSNLEYLTFLEMIGQHFDIVWSYINGINRVRKVENKVVDGISDKLVYELLESFGWDPKQPFSGQELWQYAFGLNKDGNVIGNNNSQGNSITPGYTPEQARNQVWRRILNNLPYLLKHKGTRKSINAILACYGVPSSLLSIVEFGGPSSNPGELTKYTYEDRTAMLNLSPTEYVTLPWITGSSSPDSVQLRFNTTNRQTSQLLRGKAGSYYWNVYIEPTGSAKFGNVTFDIVSDKKLYSGGSLSTTSNFTSSVSIENIPLFDGDFKHITIQREESTIDSLDYDVYTLHIKEAVDDRLILNRSASLSIQVSSSNSLFEGNEFYTNIPWTNQGTIIINGSGSNGISGSIDEFRMWNTALSSSVINSHTLNPDVINGNDVYASTDNLLVRLDFEYPKNLYSSTSIKNVAPVTGSISSATASISTNISTYPYQYEVYERFVTAEIPSIGFVGKDKVRLEDITLNGTLSYKQRASKKAFDRAPIDSNRLGLFFSPVKELNLDILRSLGAINIGDYIGDWEDEYGSDTYSELVGLRNYYFQRTNLNFDEYIRLVKSIDKSLFDMLDQVIPARANVSKGLLIEPSILDRSKIKITKPLGENIYHSSSIDITENRVLTSDFPFYTSSLVLDTDKDLEANLHSYTSSYSVQNLNVITSEYSYLTASTTFVSDEMISSDIIYNSGSTMGGIEISIDAGLQEASIIGEYDLEDAYQSVGNDADSPFNKGFGLYGENGALDRTYFREDGTLVLTQRYNAYIVTIRYSRNVPYRIPANGSGSLYRTTKLGADDKLGVEKVYRYEKKLVLIDPIENGTFKTPTAHSFYSDIVIALGSYRYGAGVITDIEVFDGYTSGHYRNTKDTTRGLENSFYMGSKQTSLTTLDGTSPVEVFVTNPNRLRVSPAGRGSGEPILEVD